MVETGMVETGMLFIAGASFLVSAIVPFLSVYAAQRLVRRDALRQATRDAFLRINKDVQDYRIAFLAHHGNLASGSSNSRQSQHDLQQMVGMLNGDCLLLGLIFDRKADPLGSRIQQLAITARMLFSNSAPPTFNDCQEELNKQILDISQQMKPLWDAPDHKELTMSLTRFTAPASLAVQWMAVAACLHLSSGMGKVFADFGTELPALTMLAIQLSQRMILIPAAVVATAIVGTVELSVESERARFATQLVNACLWLAFMAFVLMSLFMPLVTLTGKLSNSPG